MNAPHRSGSVVSPRSSAAGNHPPDHGGCPPRSEGGWAGDVGGGEDAEPVRLGDVAARPGQRHGQVGQGVRGALPDGHAWVVSSPLRIATTRSPTLAGLIRRPR